MKFDKEYPATHSMDTAWYLADADGNVAIIDYNDNGPLPWGTEENCIENLVFGRTNELINEEQIKINLTDDQLDLLLQDPHTPEEEEYWTCIVQIDPSREDEYLMLAKKEGFLENNCLSKKRGLYYISSIESTYPTKQGKWVLYKKSLIRKMISEGIIQKVYREPNHPLADDLLENGIEPIPFFVFLDVEFHSVEVFVGFRQLAQEFFCFVGIVNHPSAFCHVATNDFADEDGVGKLFVAF